MRQRSQKFSRSRIDAIALLALLALAGRCDAVQTLEVVDPADPAGKIQIVGDVIVQARDGGVMLQADDGRIWSLQPDQILSRTDDDSPLVPIDNEEMARRLLLEFPVGFKIHRTTHYVIAHNSDDLHAKQVGSLFERLYRSFYPYWQSKRWKLEQPKFPLVAILFDDHDSFLQYASQSIGEMARSVIGYYHLESNRMIAFNVPNLERNVATIIHEGTHQLAYNSGLQRRFADNPMWVSEGMATFFEASDVNNPATWRGVGRINEVNLMRWRKAFPTRGKDTLIRLLRDDQMFRDAATSEAAYAESWALTYFLIRTRRTEYLAYLKKLSEGKPLVQRSPGERLEMFESTFGETLDELDKQFVTYLSRTRVP